MDWFRTKNILIFVLLILNITLFSVYYRTNAQNKIVENQTQKNIISILEKNNIKLEKKLIPETPKSFTSSYIERVVTDNIPFIIKLLGNSYSYNEENNTYKTETKSLSIAKDTFTYTDSAPSDAPKEKSEKYIKEYCIKKLKELDIDYKIYDFDGLNYNQNSIKAIFTPIIGDYRFFDAYISFEISENGITSISGKNMILSKTASKISTKVFDISSVLLDLCSNSELNRSQINNIVKIRLGHYIGNTEERYSNVLAIPAWQIVMDNGSILYYDARNGDFLRIE